jgi:hypothetical protein
MMLSTVLAALVLIVIFLVGGAAGFAVAFKLVAVMIKSGYTIDKDGIRDPEGKEV